MLVLLLHFDVCGFYDLMFQNFRCCGRHVDFQLNGSSSDVGDRSIEFVAPKTGVGIGIMFVTRRAAEMRGVGVCKKAPPQLALQISSRSLFEG